MSQFDSWLTTNTRYDIDEVSQWLGSLENWNSAGQANGLGYRRCFKTTDKSVTAIVIDVGNHRPGTATASIEILGSSSTIVFDMFVSREHSIGRLDQMYKLAFEFCKWDRECSVVFALDDDNRGVFRRRAGQYLVNPKEFYSASLAEYLTFPYQIADNPTSQLLKSGWFE